VALAIKAVAATAETPNFEDAAVDSGDVSALWRSYVDNVLSAVGR
jgi:hypothetical protein